METISWECFLREIKVIYDISQQLNDNWQIICANDDMAGTYLVKSQSIELNTNACAGELHQDGIEAGDFEEKHSHLFESISEAPLNHSHKQLIRFEYHVLYHISYAVPYLCFNAFKSNGSMLTLDEAWKIFNDFDTEQSHPTHLNMLNVLTQMEHPILFRPFLTLHPCRIAEVLRTLPNSQNKVLSFLSIYGPSVRLTFDLEYAKYFKQIEKENKNH